MLLTKHPAVTFLLATAGCIQVSFASFQARDVVDLGCAKYMGNRSFPNTVAFLGLPYAEPPLGDGRFRAPVPLNTTRIAEEFNHTIIDASQSPQFCVQGYTFYPDLQGPGGAGTEDCLNVNIYAPVGFNSARKWPVLVYFHGGGYAWGNPLNWPFDHWVNQVPEVVIVSVYYRLDSFGFMGIPEFRDGILGDINAGFLDQTEALRWIRQHISVFGGDSSRITISGHSAGGSSVILHLVANQEQMFHQAIVQSPFRVAISTPEQQKPLFDFYAARVGCELGTLQDQLSCLRNASISAIAMSQDEAETSPLVNGSYKFFRPVLDGKILTDYPTRAIVNGRSAKVPLLIGACSNETSESLNGSTTDISTTMPKFFPQLNTTDIEEFLEVYPASDFTSAGQRFQVVTGESISICAREEIGSAFARENLPVFSYRYNQPDPTAPIIFGPPPEVQHGAENWMMFRGTEPGLNGTTRFEPMSPVDIAFSEELIAYWLSFVRSGNPNTFKLDKSPLWPRYTNSGKERVVLQEDPMNSTTRSGIFVEVEPELESRRCAFVESKSVKEQI